MVPILSFGYVSAALLTVVAAVVIGAFWVGWGLLSPAGDRKDAPRNLASSCAAREEKGDASVETGPVHAAKEEKKKKKGAFMGMAPLSEAREVGKDAVAMDRCAATTVGGERKAHEFAEGVGVALVGGSGRVLAGMVASTAEREDEFAEIAPVRAVKEKKGDLTEMVLPPAATGEEKDPVADERAVHEHVEEGGAALVSVEERVPADIAPSTAEREEEEEEKGAFAETAPVTTVKEDRDALTEMAPAPVLREDENVVIAADLRAASAVEGEGNVHDIVKEVDAAVVSGNESDVPLEDTTALTVEDTNKADGPMKSEAADKREIRELTLEELKAYDGSDVEKPLLLAIKGNVYDVSRSRLLYGPGGQYELFGGRDVTRALAVMSFEPEDLTGKIDDLKKTELEVLGDWELKFMEKYPRVGFLVAVESGDGKQQP